MGLELHALDLGFNLAGILGAGSTLNSRVAKETNSLPDCLGLNLSSATGYVLPNIFML